MAKKKITYDEMLKDALDVERLYDLPDGWIWVKLVDGYSECKDNYRKPINSNERQNRIGDVPYYGATGQVGYIDGYLTNEELVLVGEDGAPFLDFIKDKAYMISGKAWVNNHAHILKAFTGSVGNKYILHYLNIFDYSDYVNGATRLKLTQKNMRKIPLPLPPLEEQQRIVDRIESLFEKLDRAKELMQEALDSFENRRSAILHKAFTGELTAKWREENGVSLDIKDCLLDTFILNIEAGKSFRCDERTPLQEEVGVAKVSALTWGEYDENESKTCTDITKINERLFIKAGDFLLSRANTIELVGACVIAKNVNKRIMLSDKTLRIILSDKIDNEYLLYFMNSMLGRQRVQELATGNQDSMRNISQKNIKKIQIPICSLEEQCQIASILDYLFEKEDSAMELINIIDDIDIMKKTILAKAFRGELGTSNPDDEPAIKLVEQIVRERYGANTLIPIAKKAILFDSMKYQDNIEDNMFITTANKTKEIENMERIRLVDYSKIERIQTMEDIFKLLLEHEGTASPQKLYKASGLSIDEFYSELKKYVNQGKISEVKEPDGTRKLVANYEN